MYEMFHLAFGLFSFTFFAFSFNQREVFASDVAAELQGNIHNNVLPRPLGEMLVKRRLRRGVMNSPEDFANRATDPTTSTTTTTSTAPPPPAASAAAAATTSKATTTKVEIATKVETTPKVVLTPKEQVEIAAAKAALAMAEQIKASVDRTKTLIKGFKWRHKVPI